jgi:purine-nucleoside phosphorylase
LASPAPHPPHKDAPIGYVDLVPDARAAQLDALASGLASKADARPAVGVVLGSGLGAFGDQLEHAIPYGDLPGMPVSTVPGHAGNLRLGRIDGVGVACLQGRVHLYEGHDAGAVVFGVRLLARLGCRAIILTNAAGGIAQGLEPGDRMLITDHINLTGQNPLTGPSGPLSMGDPVSGGAGSPPADAPMQFVDMSAAYDPHLAELCHTAARETRVPLKQGVYAGLTGPSYETPAEIRMLRAMGADAVGMSTVLEVIALRQLGVRVAAISCITNLAAGISKVPLDHYEVQEIARKSAAPFVAFLSRATALIGNEMTA